MTLKGGVLHEQLGVFIIAATGPWLRGSLGMSFLLGRNLKYALLELKGSDEYDSLNS